MSMAALVHDSAKLYPDKDALSDGQQRYTFGELERFSDNFAAFLLSRGVRRGDRVAFCSATASLDAVTTAPWRTSASATRVHDGWHNTPPASRNTVSTLCAFIG